MKNSILFDFFSDELEINNGNLKKKEIIGWPVAFWIFLVAREMN